MKNIEELKSELIQTEMEIEQYEIDPYDLEDEYCEMLDEYGPVKIGTLEYSASMVLREIDPTAYRCGLLDYADSVDKEETAKYKGMEERAEELREEIEELESEIDTEGTI